MSARHRKQSDPKMEALNARLNASETMLRARIGDQRVDDLIERFRATGMKDPALFHELYAKRDPYRWIAQYWAPRHARTQKGVEVLRRVFPQRFAH